MAIVLLALVLLAPAVSRAGIVEAASVPLSLAQMAGLPLWAQLGPLEPKRVLALAPSPAWPTDPTLLAVRERDVIRTRDGGWTWERLPALPDGWMQVAVAPSAPPQITVLGPTPTPSTASVPTATAPVASRAPLAPATPAATAVATAVSTSEGKAPAASMAEHVVFALFPGRVLRSSDTGSTWSAVLTLPPGLKATSLVLSPAFDQDGLAFVLAGTHYFRTKDGGLTWDDHDLQDQQVQQIVFSPDVAHDHKLFVVEVSGGFPSVSEDTGSGDASDHQRSAGVLVSSDQGDSFRDASTGLAVEGTPYRHVQRLFVSPTFAQDGTLFAYTWGPRNARGSSQSESSGTSASAGGSAAANDSANASGASGTPGTPGTPGAPGTSGPADGSNLRTLASALFVSTDRGNSWSPVRTFAASLDRRSLALAFSPTFGQDGIALLADSVTGRTTAFSSCEVLRTTDRGQRWQPVLARESYATCNRLDTFGGGVPFGAVVQRGYTWQKSLDGGATWNVITDPVQPPAVDGTAATAAAGTASFVGSVSLARGATGQGKQGNQAASGSTSASPYGPALSMNSPVVAIDGELLIGAPAGGVWLLGQRVQSTQGAFDCPRLPTGASLRLWQGDAWVRSQLGCALADPEPITVRERRDAVESPVSVRHGLWLEDSPSDEAETDHWPVWFNLLGDSSSAPTGAYLSVLPKSSQPWPANQPSRHYQTTVQRFDGGLLLTTVGADGKRALLVLSIANATWRQFPLPS